jgi:hypothetical protein
MGGGQEETAREEACRGCHESYDITNLTKTSRRMEEEQFGNELGQLGDDGRYGSGAQLQAQLRGGKRLGEARKRSNVLQLILCLP